MAWHLHWQPSEIGGMPWIDVWLHYDRLGDSLADSLTWQANIAAISSMDRRGIERLFSLIDKLRTPRVSALKSIYEQASDEERIRLIGSAIDSAGEKWLRSHPVQASWLSSRGITAEQCVSAFRDYYEKQAEISRRVFE